ncbi:YopX family protein [Lentilactobacillus parabuchneri]|uniref:YopX family protein n=1 Tax=Lentilactobacillus parabuchneri TaxID=152331 RepID=UPI0031D15DAE
MIKFRAWHMPFGPKGAMQEMVHGKASRLLAFAEMSPDEYIVEQYTGIKDVNGNYIYEGDVLENPKYRSVVKFGSGSFYADVIGAVNRFPLAGEWQTSVVIGNVHTNPELLEEEK